MPISITSDDLHLKAVQARLAQFKNLYPLTRRIGQHLLRAAQRNAPVGEYKGGSLRKSLNVAVPEPGTIVLQSPLRYAAIQNYGGTIVAGSGPLGSKLLAVPLNATARAFIDEQGASVSLRTRNLFLVKSRAGRLLLVQIDMTRGGGRGKGSRGTRRQGRYSGVQILFVLVPRVTITPKHYAPRLSDPTIARAVAAEIRAHLAGTGGSA